MAHQTGRTTVRHIFSSTGKLWKELNNTGNFVVLPSNRNIFYGALIGKKRLGYNLEPLASSRKYSFFTSRFGFKPVRIVYNKNLRPTRLSQKVHASLKKSLKSILNLSINEGSPRSPKSRSIKF